MTQPSILEIVRRCQQHPNDRKAFDLFYRNLYPYVRLYARAFRLPTAPVTEEDVIQEIFLKLMEKFPETDFQNENQFLGYLKAASENYMIDLVRKYEKQTYTELTEELQLAASGETPEQAAANAERLERLLRLVSALSGTCHGVLLPFLRDGLSLADIARRQNVPLGTIYPRFSRCVGELRRRMSQN
jgi:RNA polymerase sigma factor (sigma-70 family)